MAITVEARTSLIELVVGMFGAAPGASVLSDLVAAYEAGSSIKQIATSLANTSEFKGIFPTFLTNGEYATKVVNQLLAQASDTAKADAVAVLTAELNGGMSRVDAMIAGINFVNGTASTNTAYGTSAAAFDNKVVVATYYSVEKQLSGSSLSVLQNVIGNVTNVASTVEAAKANADGTSSTGKVFTLTTGVDNGDAFKGGASDDSFNALIDGTTAANTTISAADTFSGGNGTDTLNITYQGGAVAGIPAADITGIETVNVRAVGTGAVTAIDLSIIPGVTTFNSDRSTQDVSVTKAATGAAVGIIGNGTTVNGSLNYAYSTASTAQTINISGGVTNSGTANITATASTGVTTATINSTGASNSVDTILLDSAGANTVTSLTVNAATNLTATLTAADYAATSALKVSGAATAVSLSTPGNFKTIDASGLTAGGLTIALGTNNTSFKGGAGSDVVTTAGIATTVASAIDAGAGTADRLIVAATADVDTAAEAKLYAGFDVLQVGTGVDVDMSLFTNSTITSERVSGVVTLNKLTATQATAITMTASSTLTATVVNATDVGQLDTVTIDVSNLSAAVGAVGAITITTPTLSGVETVNLKATDGFTVTALTGLTALTNLNVTGAAETSVTTGALALNVNTVFDFSGTTGANTFVATAATTNAFSYKGGSAVDTVTDSAIGGSSIVTGAGKDVITVTAKTGGTAGSVFTTGAAADTITVTAAKGNDAIDKLTFKFAAGDSIIDTNAVTGNATTGYSTASTDNITGVDFAAAAAAAAGHVITLDTAESATAVTFSTTAVTFGTTTVTNANDFYVYDDTAGNVYVYQDTNGDKIISNGEFGIKLVGAAAANNTTAGEFAVVSGNLVVTTV